MPVHAQAHADAGAPGRVGAVAERAVAVRKAPQRRSASSAAIASFSTRTELKTWRNGASSGTVCQSLGSALAAATPPQMFGAASSIAPSRTMKGPHDATAQ